MPTFIRGRKKNNISQFIHLSPASNVIEAISYACRTKCALKYVKNMAIMTVKAWQSTKAENGKCAKWAALTQKGPRVKIPETTHGPSLKT